MIKQILFPTDFSKYSQKAREYALYLSQKLDAKVYILHAIEPIQYDEYDEEVRKFYEMLEDEVRKRILEEKKYFEEQYVEAFANIVIGKRWKVINTYAKEKEIDLIVMGTHGFKTEDGDITIGTTSHKVMFTSPCPLLIVRGNGEISSYNT